MQKGERLTLFPLSLCEKWFPLRCSQKRAKAREGRRENGMGRNARMRKAKE
jgi:hypothetical protein